ncbi:MAG: HPr family phosphocarrier protein [Lachnospiraceae bacterium]|nr:HPr family phosphocarrier protein [Lachnospiraceae bacterium]MCD7833299.1 HPr family phosphocarrier protein [Lachnospiraceae bacterium]
MFTKKIRLKTVDEVREFVKAADKCSFHVDIRNGETLIDAKSIMGVMSLDLTEKLAVVYEEADPELEQVLEKFQS